MNVKIILFEVLRLPRVKKLQTRSTDEVAVAGVETHGFAPASAPDVLKPIPHTFVSSLFFFLSPLCSFILIINTAFICSCKIKNMGKNCVCKRSTRKTLLFCLTGVIRTSAISPAAKYSH